MRTPTWLLGDGMPGGHRPGLFFLLLLVVLFAQFGFSLLFHEPYPAIKYPAFQTIHSAGNSIEVSRPEATVCLVGEEPRSIAFEKLFAPVPRSFTINVIETLNGLAVPYGGEEARPRVRRLGAESSTDSSRLGTWLKERIAAEYGSVEATQVAIQWYRDRIQPPSSVEVGKGTLTDVLYIDLSAGGRTGGSIEMGDNPGEPCRWRLDT